MWLSELIEYLEAENEDRILSFGFAHPHSYRGYYDRLAFEPAWNVRVGDMLKDAKESKGKTFMGYKGGDYTMDGMTEVYIAKYSECGDEISKMLLDYIFEKGHPREKPDAR